MSGRRPADVTAFFERNPTLKQIRAAYPDEWQQIHQELELHATRGEPLEQYITALGTQTITPQGKGRVKRQEAIGSAIAKQHIARALLQRTALRVASGQSSGRIRFNLLNGWLMQGLLFSRGLERKPVSMLRFRLTWPLISQRRLLMPLVQPQGIYCFYTRLFIEALADMIDGQDAVEIAAGDGTLTRFLTEAGAEIIATDDQSWEAVSAGLNVINEDAKTTLSTRSPQTVICSWPPAGNHFEQHVFKTPSVNTYIVIASRHKFASGNWAAYSKQNEFTMKRRPDLARLLLPPELESDVFEFRRTTHLIAETPP